MSRNDPETVGDAMTPVVYTLSVDDGIEQAAGKLLRQGVSGCPVLEGERLVGVISELDLMRALYGATQGGPVSGCVGDHMTPCPVTLGAASPLIDAAHFFFEYPLRRAPVVDATGRLVGQISRRDVLRSLERHARRVRLGSREVADAAHG